MLLVLNSFTKNQSMTKWQSLTIWCRKYSEGRLPDHKKYRHTSFII